VKLPHLPAWTAARRALAAAYRAGLAGLGDLQLPPDHPEHVHHQFVIRTGSRDALRRHLAAAGIQTEIYYPEPLHLQPCFARLGRPPLLPQAERAAATVLALPLRPTMPPGVIEAIVMAISRFFAS
jgi:dTDP-4-amino-4,6-dideoxygalactose transaminase